ncbi:MAG: glycosyltransferase [Microbacteriaceae bacterium]|nr:glycosyltransferase [Microbacteriaceae bacterium]
MENSGKRVAMVSMHTSPSAPAGSRDAGGMNVFIRSVATELAGRGVQVDLLTRAEGEPAVTELSAGVTLRELRAGPAGMLPKNQLIDATDEFGEAVADLASRRDLGYSAIHAHYWLSGIATLPVALACGIPFVQSFHTLAVMKNASRAAGQQPEDELRQKSEMFLAGQASAVIAASAAEATALVDEVRAPASRVWVIPPGVDIDTFTPERAVAGESAVRALLGLGANQPILVVAGRIQPLKAQDLAIRTLASQTASTTSAIEMPVLVIAGEATPGDDDYLFSLHALVAQLGLGSRVFFVGALDRGPLADLLAAAAIVLLPSHSETFGLVAIEAAASGTPVIGFRTSGLLDAVAEGRSGVLVDSRDPEVWGAAVAALLRDTDARSSLARLARHHAEGYTWRATAATLLSLYASVGADVRD